MSNLSIIIIIIVVEMDYHLRKIIIVCLEYFNGVRHENS